MTFFLAGIKKTSEFLFRSLFDDSLLFETGICPFMACAFAVSNGHTSFGQIA
jgi:hypothetical protein